MVIKKPGRMDREGFFVLCLFVCFLIFNLSGLKKAVHSREKNNELSLFIAAVLGLVFISCLVNCPDLLHGNIA